MLFLLSGGVQIGKTRWLEHLVSDLAAEGVESWGVLAPGVWKLQEVDANESSTADLENTQHFEKLGIDNVLLPQGERLAFARRRDLAQDEGTFNPASQSSRARLAWDISDKALDQVNAHFEVLLENNFFSIKKRTNVSRETFCVPSTAPVSDASMEIHSEQGEHNEHVEQGELGEYSVHPSLLVIDELGRLELQHGGGLTSALEVLKRGATEHLPHAVVVIRAWLLDGVAETYSSAWGGVATVAPDESARTTIRRAFDLLP